jgi:hypothetical protein
VGKTTLARTVKPLGRTLILSGESGLAPLAGEDIAVLEVKSVADLAEFSRALVGNAEELAPFEVLFIDSLTEMGKIIEADLYAKFAETDDKGVRAVPKKANFAYYGALSRQLEGFVRMIRDAKKHVFFSALPKSWRDDDTGLSGVRPSYGSASVAELLPGMFDFVFAYRLIPHPETGEPARVLFTEEREGWAAKARQKVGGKGLPLAIRDPDLSAIARQAIDLHKE